MERTLSKSSWTSFDRRRKNPFLLGCDDEDDARVDDGLRRNVWSEREFLRSDGRGNEDVDVALDVSS